MSIVEVTKPVLMRVTEVAKYLGISRTALYQWIEEGLIPRPMRVRKVLYWQRHKIQDWLDAGMPPCEEK